MQRNISQRSWKIIWLNKKIDEKILKYKLEAYQKNFLDFIYGSPTSTEVLGHDEETEVRPNGIAQEEEMQNEEP